MKSSSSTLAKEPVPLWLSLFCFALMGPAMGINAAFLARGRREVFGELLRGAMKFRVEFGDEFWAVELEQLGERANGAAQINRGGEVIVTALFERPDLIGLELGGFSDLLNLHFHRFASEAQLFGNRGHPPHK